jgi:hypothetical protein
MKYVSELLLLATIPLWLAITYQVPGCRDLIAFDNPIAQSTWLQFDSDEDGDVDAADILAFLDRNKDGRLSAEDLVKLVHDEFDPTSPGITDSSLDAALGSAPLQIGTLGEESTLLYAVLLPFRLAYLALSLMVRLLNLFFAFTGLSLLLVLPTGQLQGFGERVNEDCWEQMGRFFPAKDAGILVHIGFAMFFPFLAIAMAPSVFIIALVCQLLLTIASALPFLVAVSASAMYVYVFQYDAISAAFWADAPGCLWLAGVVGLASLLYNVFSFVPGAVA